GRDQRALWVLVQQVQPLVGVLGVRVRVRVRVRGRGRREREDQRLRFGVELIAGQRFGENRYGRLFGDRLEGVAAGGRLFAVHQPPDTRDVGERVTVLGALSGRHGDGLGRSLHDDGQGVALPCLVAIGADTDQGHRVLAGGGRRAGDARAVPGVRLGGQVC